MALCDSCQESHDGWLTKKWPAIQWVSGVNHYANVQGLKAHQAERRKLVIYQLDLIADICKRNHQAVPTGAASVINEGKTK